MNFHCQCLMQTSWCMMSDRSTVPVLLACVASSCGCLWQPAARVCWLNLILGISGWCWRDCVTVTARPRDLYSKLPKCQCQWIVMSHWWLFKLAVSTTSAVSYGLLVHLLWTIRTYQRSMDNVFTASVPESLSFNCFAWCWSMSDCFSQHTGMEPLSCHWLSFLNMRSMISCFYLSWFIW